MFDFFSHNVPHVQQADFSDLVVLFANLQAESSGLEVAGDSGVAQLGEMMGGTHTGLQRGQAMALRTLSPSPDEVCIVLEHQYVCTGDALELLMCGLLSLSFP